MTFGWICKALNIYSFSSKGEKIIKFIHEHGFHVSIQAKRLPTQQFSASFKSYNGLTGQIRFAGPEKLYRNLKVVEFMNGGLQEINRSSAPAYVYRGNNEQQEKEN